MAQNTVYAANTAAGTSTDIVVAAGASVNVGIFPATGSAFTITGDLATIMLDTPGADVAIAKLTDRCPSVAVSGPGTYRVVKPATAIAIGVFTET
jgi:hypothetical protein